MDDFFNTSKPYKVYSSGNFTKLAENSLEETEGDSLIEGSDDVVANCEDGKLSLEES